MDHWTDKPNPEFEQWWATKRMSGYDYGREALENVRFGFEGANERIHQLEKLNATLAEQVDRMQPVITATQGYCEHDQYGWDKTESLRVVREAVDTYEQQMAALGKGGG